MANYLAIGALVSYGLIFISSFFMPEGGGASIGGGLLYLLGIVLAISSVISQEKKTKVITFVALLVATILVWVIV